ncbi:zinc finger protein 709 [Sardina pilchardus]|uniref:zinc finger protein 709 n=1 Tax=Sardina pilchardus TaxID=27697 RepID=UPI002E0D840B
MSESVSDFQSQVVLIMDVLMRVAVKEITKLFEGRCIDPGRSKVENVEEPRPRGTSILLSDIRTDMENALKHCGDDYKCSVGVQVEDDCIPREKEALTHPQPNPHPHPLCSSHQSPQKEGGMASMERPRIGGVALEAVDLHCTVDLPCMVLKDRVVESGSSHTNSLSGTPQAELPSATDDTMELNSLFDSLKKSLAWPESQEPECPPKAIRNKKEQPVPSEDDLVCDKSVSHSETLLITTTSTPKALSDPCSDSSHFPSCTPSPEQMVVPEPPPSPLRHKTVHFQLGVNHKDWKLLKPCSVQLVNVRLLATASGWPRVRLAGPKRFPRPKDLRAHQGLHTGRRLCCFTECGNGVWRLQQRVLSSSSSSSSSSAPPSTAGSALACKICGKNFKRRKMLRRHERFHTGERPYPCTLCSKAFTLRKSLRRHLRFHSGERPHGCPHCGKCFRLKDNLKTHLRFHTGERPYACTLCPKSYRILRNLESHSLTH